MNPAEQLRAEFPGWVITAEGDRWARSRWPIGRDTDLNHVADLIEDAMRRSAP
jgi:hypothetical protein